MAGLGLEQRFNVADGQKTITFMGWQLGFASSENEDSVRWTELGLFRTLQGSYVLEKIGRSDVFHSETCNLKDRNNKPKSKGKRYPNLLEALPEDVITSARIDDPEDELEEVLHEYFVPCEHCNPAYGEVPVWVEKDIFSAPVYSSAEKVVDALYQTRGDNRFLSRIARSLLDQAMEKDLAIAEAVRKPVEIK
jgi:hypothetical protein